MGRFLNLPGELHLPADPQWIVALQHKLDALKGNAMKQWFTSKTVWLNVAMFVTALASLTEFTGLLNSQELKLLVAGAAVLNLILRVFFTNQPIANPANS